jgi:hypothetical protein
MKKSPEELLKETKKELLSLKKERKKLVDALWFYGNPETYFGIGFAADKPCGKFENDFEDPQWSHPVYGLAWSTVSSSKPGKLARKILNDIGHK